jgi:hypothetical protein
MIFRYVPFADVPRYLYAGWETVIPRSTHPALDAYRVLLLWRCACMPKFPD